MIIFIIFHIFPIFAQETCSSPEAETECIRSCDLVLLDCLADCVDPFCNQDCVRQSDGCYSTCPCHEEMGSPKPQIFGECFCLYQFLHQNFAFLHHFCIFT